MRATQPPTLSRPRLPTPEQYVAGQVTHLTWPQGLLAAQWQMSANKSFISHSNVEHSHIALNPDLLTGSCRQLLRWRH